MAKVSVLIPLKNRATILATVDSIRREGGKDWEVIVIDNGSHCSITERALQCLERAGAAEVIQEGGDFNRARLLNRGLGAATGSIVLISDADILWNHAALRVLIELSPGQEFRHVRTVRESEPALLPNRAHVYDFAVRHEGSRHTLRLFSRKPKPGYRSGPGLIAGFRKDFLAIGGYSDNFHGWGWEDKDILIRAILLGFEIIPCGEVIHISHTDTDRSAGRAARSLEEERDLNILQSISNIQRGRLLGPLSNSRPNPSLDIAIRLPRTLMTECSCD